MKSSIRAWARVLLWRVLCTTMCTSDGTQLHLVFVYIQSNVSLVCNLGDLCSCQCACYAAQFTARLLSSKTDGPFVKHGLAPQEPVNLCRPLSLLCTVPNPGTHLQDGSRFKANQHLSTAASQQSLISCQKPQGTTNSHTPNDARSHMCGSEQLQMPSLPIPFPWHGTHRCLSLVQQGEQVPVLKQPCMCGIACVNSTKCG